MKTEKGAWSLYLAGALRGVVGILSVWVAGQCLGSSPTFVRTGSSNLSGLSGSL